MSTFSGKCDFRDEIEIWGLQNILDAKVFLGCNSEPLKLTCLEDCVQYFPHIVTMSFGGGAGGRQIYLSEKSWVDMEAERYGELPIHQFYRDKLRDELIKAGKL